MYQKRILKHRLNERYYERMRIFVQANIGYLLKHKNSMNEYMQWMCRF